MACGTFAGQDVVPLWSSKVPLSGTLSPGHSKAADVWAKHFSGRDEHVLIGAIAGGGLYALPAPPEMFAAGQGEHEEMPSTSVVPLEDTSQWKVVQVEEGAADEMESLSCYLGIQQLDVAQAPKPWLPKPPSIEEVRVAGNSSLPLHLALSCPACVVLSGCHRGSMCCLR